MGGLAKDEDWDSDVGRVGSLVSVCLSEVVSERVFCEMFGRFSLSKGLFSMENEFVRLEHELSLNGGSGKEISNRELMCGFDINLSVESSVELLITSELLTKFSVIFAFRPIDEIVEFCSVVFVVSLMSEPLFGSVFCVSNKELTIDPDFDTE